MFLYQIRHAFRLLVRDRGFTAAALLTLALGVGANVAVFAVFEAVLLRPLPFGDAERLVILRHRDQRTGITKEFIALGDFVDLVSRQSTFTEMVGYGGMDRTIFGVGDPFRVAALGAGPGLFESLGVSPFLGRGIRPDDTRPNAPPVIVLGYHLWQSRFGSDRQIVGRGVKVGDAMHQVVGVAPRGFHFPPSSPTDVIVPITVPIQTPAERKSGWIFSVARLKPNLSVDDANANLTAISRQLEQEFPQANQGSQYFALPLRDALVGTTKPALLLLLGAVGVVLLIACANVANLLLARSLSRQREMAVRTALGASRGQLLAQLLMESLALAIAAGVAGVAAAYWGSRALLALIPKSVNVPGLADVGIDARVLGFALGLTVITALVFGFIAAFAVRTSGRSDALGAPTRVSVGRLTRRWASGLVVLEVTLAIVLLVGAGLILRSFSRLLAVDPGFRTDHVMTMEIALPSERYANEIAQRALYDRAFAALGVLSGVEDVGAAVVVPLTGNNWTIGFERLDQPLGKGERPPDVGWQLASGGYFKALQIPLLAGRLFDAGDKPGGKPVVIVSEAIQRRFFGNEPAVGHQVRSGDTTYEIVGVVGDIRRAELRDEPRAELYQAFESYPQSQITLFVRTTGDPGRQAASIQTTLRSIEPEIVFTGTSTMADIARESVQVTKLALSLLAVFAATALALAAVGIYGVMSYVVRQRTREIGMRVALGATKGDILWLVMRQGAGIAAVGTVAGVGLGLIASRSMAALLFGVSTWDPATLGISAVVLIVTTLVACYLPARRAAAVDPARTLADQ